MKLDPTVVAVVVYQFIITIPLVFALVRTWLTVQTNKLLITQRPTHDDVQAQIDQKVMQLAQREPSRSTDTVPSPISSGAGESQSPGLKPAPDVSPPSGSTP